jgi:hypothetical protein
LRKLSRGNVQDGNRVAAAINPMINLFPLQDGVPLTAAHPGA